MLRDLEHPHPESTLLILKTTDMFVLTPPSVQVGDVGTTKLKHSFTICDDQLQGVIYNVMINDCNE